MPYVVDDDEPPGSGFHGLRPGISATDLVFDEPGAAAAFGGSGDAGWGDADDDALVTGTLWGGPRFGGLPGPRRPVRPRPRPGRFPRGARPAGRRRGRELELEDEFPGELEGEDETFPMGALPYAGPGYLRPYPALRFRGRKAARRVGWRLRLPHASLHTILARMSPAHLRLLAGGRLPADPTPAVVSAVGAIARRARPAGRLSGGYTVFATPGWHLLVRPVGELEGEIVSLRPARGAEGEFGPPFAAAFAPEQRPGVQMGGTGPAPPIPTPTPAAKTIKVSFVWKKGCTLDQACPKHGQGFYVIYNPSKKPIYAGMADDFYKRMLSYSHYGRIFERTLKDYQVYFASGTGLSDPLLERYIIRTTIVLAGATKNVEKITPAKLSDYEIVVTHTGAGGDIPGFLKQNPKPRKDANGRVIKHTWDKKKAVTTIEAKAEYELPLLAA